MAKSIVLQQHISISKLTRRLAAATLIPMSFLLASLSSVHAKPQETKTAHPLDFTVELSERVISREFPSASGVVISNEEIYAVGDDSPYLFTLDKAFTIKDKFELKHYPIGEDNRINKKIKPDYEAMDIIDYRGKEAFVVFGSGSKKPTREWGYL